LTGLYRDTSAGSLLRMAAIIFDGQTYPMQNHEVENVKGDVDKAVKNDQKLLLIRVDLNGGVTAFLAWSPGVAITFVV